MAAVAHTHQFSVGGQRSAVQSAKKHFLTERFVEDVLSGTLVTQYRKSKGPVILHREVPRGTGQCALGRSSGSPRNDVCLNFTVTSSLGSTKKQRGFDDKKSTRAIFT
uniref:Uncharacterized protein n=1 Tax=Romanomermis culicivorax TaxID=13658 RepID=A0A915L1B2_ROMCU